MIIQNGLRLGKDLYNMNNNMIEFIKVLLLVSAYGVAGWVLIGVSLAMVNHLSINTTQVKRNRINHNNSITATQNNYRRVV